MDEGRRFPPGSQRDGQPGGGPVFIPAPSSPADTELELPPYTTGEADAPAADAGPDEHTTVLTGLLPGEPEERRTGRTVAAEWALWGKRPDDPKYGVLRCSEGPLGHGHFDAIITRYASGEQDSLPQYTVCWVPDEKGHEGYLAVAIHELADPDPRRSGGRVRTARGREIEYTRLFCVSYSEMAKNQVGYTELVESVQPYQLPAGPTEPITVELLDTEPSALPAPFAALAENVATLLLTTRPVCVLGAAVVSAEERLRFIDRVMSLLPYGLRVQMSASTWASATARNLKLRLFFAGAKREDGGATVYVNWGQSGRFDSPGPEHTTLRRYVNWLEGGGAGAVAELASQREPVRFVPGEIREMIANLPNDRPVTDTLEELDEGLRHAQLQLVWLAVKRLEQPSNRPRNLEERKEYRREIKRLGLFKDRPGIPSQTGANAYRALLGLAYKSGGVSYANYREIVGLAGGPLYGMLGREVLRLGFNSYLAWLLTSKSATEFTDQQLMASLRKQRVAATKPITEFCDHLGNVLQEDRRVLYDFAVDYLRAYSADPAAELVKLAYLTGTLEAVFPRDRQAQRVRITEMLVLVYKGTLSEEQSAELLSHPGIRHTAAFDEAVKDLTAGRGHRKRPSIPIPGVPKPIPIPGVPKPIERAARAKVTVNAVSVVFGLMLIAALAAIIIIFLLLHRIHA